MHTLFNGNMFEFDLNKRYVEVGVSRKQEDTKQNDQQFILVLHLHPRSLDIGEKKFSALQNVFTSRSLPVF